MGWKNIEIDPNTDIAEIRLPQNLICAELEEAENQVESAASEPSVAMPSLDATTVTERKNQIDCTFVGITIFLSHILNRSLSWQARPSATVTRSRTFRT